VISKNPDEINLNLPNFAVP